MNKYDLEHACTAHPRMSKQEWQQVYGDAWTRYYSDAHVETIMRRAWHRGISTNEDSSTRSSSSPARPRIEGVHPLQFGFLRRKMRTQRRYGLPISPRSSSIRAAWASWRLPGSQWLRLSRRINAIARRVVEDPAAAHYIDEALLPPAANESVPHFVEVFADKIPKTHGAPMRDVAEAAE